MDRYLLIGQTPVICEDLEEWALGMESLDRTVFKTIVGPYEVSTIFLGLDTNFTRMITGKGEPRLFETMIFSAGTTEVKLEWLKAHKGKPVDIGELAEFNSIGEEDLDKFLLDHQERYSTWLQAERGHELAVSLVEISTGTLRQEMAGGLELQNAGGGE